jgi:acetyl-CoA carboxylase biotin carboxyl carrier protein
VAVLALYSETDPIVSNDAGSQTVKAQMSGVFYRAAAPDQPPFVEVGGAIRKGQTIALLESMKLFSKIKAPADAVVLEICVGNEETVSVGQVLFRIQRA